MTLDPTRQLPGTAVTSNEALFDAMIRHQIHLLRMSGSIRNEVFALLNATEEDIARRVREGIRTGISSANLARAERVIKEIREIRGDAWVEVNGVLRGQFGSLVTSEIAFIDTAVKVSAPVILETTIPSASVLRSLVTTSPFEGKILSDATKQLRANDLSRIESQIRIGVIQGATTPAIARGIVGTAIKKGTDGVTQLTRVDAEGVVRTATNHFANQSRRLFFMANRDIIDEELYVATLDARTTPICRSLDGQRFPVGEGRFPPVHFRCRSLRVAILDGDVLSRRPAKPITEQQLLREFTGRRGISSVRSRADLPQGTKGAFDQFSQKRIREIVGTVPGKVTYQDWLETQAASFQDDILGKTKGKLFRAGKLPLPKFVNRAGDELTLVELAQRDAAAFRAAGLDPEDFL